MKDIIIFIDSYNDFDQILPFIDYVLSRQKAKIILYKTRKNDDGSVSIIDVSSAGSSQGNIIGVFRTNGGNQIFSENPDYFGGAE